MNDVALRPSGVRFRWLALAASVSTYLLIVVGGIVRVTGSGLGCPDWPLCHGQIVPPLEGAIFIEWSHRFVTLVTSPLILATAFAAWRGYRGVRWIFRPALAAVGLLAVQVVLGAITVLWELPPAIVALHLANALIILGLLVTITIMAFRSESDRRVAESLVVPDWFAHTVARVALGVFLVLVTGSLVTNSQASGACGGWPACGGLWIPASALSLLHMIHRYTAGLVGLGLIAVVILAWRVRRDQAPVLVSATVAGALFLGQVLVGAENVLRGFPDFLNALHLATAAAVWAGMVVFTVLAFQWARLAPVPRAVLAFNNPSEGRRAGPAWADYLALTKPVIMLLLLTTTYAAMVVAGGSFPPGGLVFWTMLGGALAAGGSSAINQVIDRQLDRLMSRTSQRPIATGRIDPAAGLAFGLVLCVAAFFVLAVFVNGVSALLALAGILYYVIGYSLLLKRKTVQNIVIGGGAGAIPPLVGWAAVAGHINIPALFLFAIVFFWTPPHFWALALLKRHEYARASVPMLPVVWGEAETRRHIFLYTLLVVALSLLLTPARVAGMLFLASAAVLGLILLGYSLRLLAGGGNRVAWRMYKFSSLYLALLFVAMVVDSIMRGA